MPPASHQRLRSTFTTMPRDDIEYINVHAVMVETWLCAAPACSSSPTYKVLPVADALKVKKHHSAASERTFHDHSWRLPLSKRTLTMD
ncbi:hypothetical protein PC114_g12641 [Phytophthora cactorum]|nr:hypothetical protein PC114_g12641 [Phytophthora cactorum]